MGRHRLSRDALGVPLVVLLALVAGRALGRASVRAAAALTVGTGGSTRLRASRGRGSGSRGLGGLGLGGLGVGSLGGLGLGRVGGLGGSGVAGTGAGAGGARRGARLPAALTGELVPPVAEHPAVKVGDLGGRASKHDEVGDASRGPVVDYTQVS